MTEKREVSNKDLNRYARAASRAAARKARKMNVPYAVQEGKNIIKIFPDGRKEVVGQVEKAFVRIPKKRYSMA